jgi:hypothetical protein
MSDLCVEFTVDECMTAVSCGELIETVYTPDMRQPVHTQLKCRSHFLVHFTPHTGTPLALLPPLRRMGGERKSADVIRWKTKRRTQIWAKNAEEKR